MNYPSAIKNFLMIFLLLSFFLTLLIAGIPNEPQAGGPLVCDVEGHCYGAAFSITLPKGLKACYGWHMSFIIPLRTLSEDRWIACSTTYNASSHKDLKELVDNYASDPPSSYDAKLISRSKMKLGDLLAERVVFHYIDEKTGISMVSDDVTALSNILDRWGSAPEYIYSISLTTTVEHYRKDRKTFEKILKTWKVEYDEPY